MDFWDGSHRKADTPSLSPTVTREPETRGPLVDEGSNHTLKDRLIAGAGLDVFHLGTAARRSSIPRHGQRRRNTHIGYGTDEAYVGFHRGNIRTIKAYLGGEQLQEFTA